MFVPTPELQGSTHCLGSEFDLRRWLILHRDVRVLDGSSPEGTTIRKII